MKNGLGSGIQGVPVVCGIDGDYGKYSQARKLVEGKGNICLYLKGHPHGKLQISHCILNTLRVLMNLYLIQSIILQMKMILETRGLGDSTKEQHHLIQVLW